MQSYNYIDSAPQPSSFLMEMETSEHHHNYVSTTTSIRNTNIIIPIKDHSATSSSSSFSTAYLKSSQPMKPSAEDPEISIFDAQKYFDETSPDSDSNYERPPSPPAALVIPLRTPRLSSVSSSSTATDIRNYNKNYRAQSFHATPTAFSEASWNSQTGLLSNPPGALPVTIRNLSDNNNNNNNNLIHKDKQKGWAGGTKWFFGRKCPCAGKKSVQVKHKIQIPPPIQLYAKREINENQELVPRIQETELVVPIHHHHHYHHPLSSASLSHDDPFSSNGLHNQHQERLSGSIRRLNEGPTGFSFPILSNAPAPVPQLSTNPFDYPPRDSLEVFQPWEDKTVPRKTGARGLGFPEGQMLRHTAMEDDIASDASSDLFEIESFSAQTTTYFQPLEEVHSFHSNPRITAGNDRSMYSCRRSMDEPMTPSIAPTEGYEPSEASIDWSVTTAEGFDRQSVTNFSVSASEIDLAVPQRQTWATSSSGGGGREGSRKKGNGGGLLLLSCRHEKAVSVGPQPVKYVTAVRGDQGQPPAMLPLVSSLRHASTRGQNCNKPLSVAGSNSARLSLAFAA